MLRASGLKPKHSRRKLYSPGTTIPENFLEVRNKVTVRVRLFPRESQPSSSTCWWTVTLKARGVFRRNNLCKVTESVGTKSFSTTQGKYTVDEDNLIVAGQLEDNSLEGRYFSLRLKRSKDGERSLPAGVLYEGTLARSKQSCDDGDWEITHDAMIYGDQSSV